MVWYVFWRINIKVYKKIYFFATQKQSFGQNYFKVLRFLQVGAYILFHCFFRLYITVTKLSHPYSFTLKH